MRSSSNEEEPSAPPTETSPLLSQPHTQNSVLGNGNGNGNDVEDGSVATSPNKHPMADKMHILLPAIGVGVNHYPYPKCL